LKLIVNHKEYNVAAEPDRPLLWVLRDELGLTGTKFSCGIGVCGSCEVQIDGVATRSCVTALSEAAGKSITTIEGLAAKDGRLHPVQQAFIDEQVPQCGWCMSGQIIRAAALLARNGNPTDEQITEEMDGNYCRCGAYGRIKKAVKKAAGQIGKDGGRP
jgi:isoquinoline 1-oxidoreductase alpha subunit